MTATAEARRLAFHPDYYLDCRRPTWQIHEDRGRVRFERPLGAKTSLVLVDDDCMDVLEVLRAGAEPWTRATRISARP